MPDVVLVTGVSRLLGGLAATALAALGHATHHPIRLDTPIPQAWRDHVLERHGRPGPESMSDGVAEGGIVWWRGWESGYDPEDPVDRAVMATREAAFPLHGLDVWFD